MTIFAIAQITREFDCTEINHSAPRAIHHKAFLQVCSTVDLVDHILEVNGRGWFARRETVRSMASDTILRIVPCSTMFVSVSVAIFALDIIDHHAAWNGHRVGHRECKGRIFCIVTLFGYFSTGIY